MDEVAFSKKISNFCDLRRSKMSLRVSTWESNDILFSLYVVSSYDHRQLSDLTVNRL